MSCPNCDHPLTQATYDNQLVLHCDVCGATYFEENGINRITIDTAQKLAGDKQEEIVSGNQKHCPKDGDIFQPIVSDELKPHDVTLLRCPTCKGVFIYPDDLLKFKSAQSTKIAFFKSWGKPLPSLNAVLVFSFIALVSFSVLTAMSTFTNKNIQQSQAHDLIKKVYITTSPDKHYVFIYFSTVVPVKSQITFSDITTGTEKTKTVSSAPQNTHSLTTGDLDLNHDLWYQITLTDSDGNIVRLEKQKLILN